VSMIEEMLPHANDVRRESVPASHLVLGLQCGGSDGYSGITANPALGAAVDLLVRHGGTAILSETPEIYGAEHLLTRRAVSKAVGEKLIERIHWWEEYTRRNGNEMNNNPSPGNKAGGLTTILEKSLGAVAKGGTTNLVAVYEYAAPVTARGFVYMDTPGYDPVSATGQVAGGANMICFTTGRGSASQCELSVMNLPDLAIALALAWGAGLRAYAVIFAVGLAGAMGWVELPGYLHVLEHPLVVAASGFMTLVEFSADKLPWLDSIWDAVHSFIRIPAGAALAAMVFGDSTNA